MTELAFPKRKRIVDPNAARRYRNAHPLCEGCRERRSQEVHHVKSRISGGDDDAGNFLALCRICHHAWTGVNQTRREWYEERKRIMSDDAAEKVRRVLRLDE